MNEPMTAKKPDRVPGDVCTINVMHSGFARLDGARGLSEKHRIGTLDGPACVFMVCCRPDCSHDNLLVVSNRSMYWISSDWLER